MSEYRTVFCPEAQAGLRKIPREMALRILAKLTELESDSLGFNTIALVSQQTADGYGSATTASPTRSTTGNWWSGSFTWGTGPPVHDT